MLYDPKTKTYTGELLRRTKDDVDRSKRLLAAGLIQSTAHPSDEDVARMNAFFVQHNIREEIEAARKLAMEDRQQNI